MKKTYLFLICLLAYGSTFAQRRGGANANTYVKDHYDKKEVYITMRDGIRLMTEIYIPKDASPSKTYPMLMQRTCYGVGPYGPDNFKTSLGSSPYIQQEGYIFVYQDVRGRYMSEGKFTNMTPELDEHKTNKDVDESTDTYDTIDWLVKNIPNNNGRVGQYGTSYPGFYTAAGILSNHPALKASSPQAPISDFFFDDFHHNGAFLESYIFTFPTFGVQTTQPTPTAWYNQQNIEKSGRDGYQFLLDIGPLTNFNKWYKDNFFFQETLNHPSYDAFWQARALPKHYKKVTPAVMLVGGWFDAEDLTGPLAIHRAIEKSDPSAYNTIVMGPFAHGAWGREAPGGHAMHSNIYFGDSIATFYERNIEAKFFYHFLKGNGDKNSGLPNAYMFDTGSKEWKTFDKWPAAGVSHEKLFLNSDGKITFTAPSKPGKMTFISDPMKPVPNTEDLTTTEGFTPRNYMSEDQRFAGRRPDVLVYETDVLDHDVTLGGEIMSHLKVATTGTDADWMVKLIDVYPPDEPNNPYMPNKNIMLSNYWQMVRSEIMPGRFRKSFSAPIPFVPNQKANVDFRLQDVLHTFKKGHRIMIQVQSTCFPLFARNPQKFLINPYLATGKDYTTATHTVFNESYVDVEVLK